MDAWTRRVRGVVRAIPRGRVASYGLVAMLAGRSGAARAVGRVMSECDDPTVPCHRVVHADGTLAAAFRGQRARLRGEGVRFVRARVDARAFRWAPRLRGVDASGGSGSPSSRTTRKDSAAL